jgi:hypothetical protein
LTFIFNAEESACVREITREILIAILLPQQENSKIIRKSLDYIAKTTLFYRHSSKKHSLGIPWIICSSWVA